MDRDLELSESPTYESEIKTKMIRLEMPTSSTKNNKTARGCGVLEKIFLIVGRKLQQKVIVVAFWSRQNIILRNIATASSFIIYCRVVTWDLQSNDFSFDL